ncbi:Pentatricopeptide repeat [Dillenia turbinata]|uniref:Pentatricopeptide repeat n=1 Tax=Dillenia turbinata TaxID=194707 RepID=A0AAN8VRI0_9MAGN
MLTAFADNGYIKKARKVFDEMPHRSTATWNAMITAYVRNGCDIEAASELFTQMPEKNSISYASMITGFVRAGMMDDAEKLFSVMPVFWREPICSNTLINGYLKMDMLEEAAKIFDGMAERDLVSWSSMVDGYCKKGSTDKARELFEKMPQRNVITWTAMIDGYMKTGCFEDGFLLFVAMRQEVVLEVNSTTLSVLFEACGSHNRYWEGYQIHGLVLCMGLECDVFLGNSILMMYCKFGRIDAANKVFQMMSKKDIVSWNSLIAGYVQNGEVEEAYEFFEKMMVKDVISWTTMISGFSSKGIMDKSVELFNMMPSKDDVAWTAIISGFVNNDEYEDAIHWYIQMVQQGVKPNSVTLSSVLSASAGMAALIQGLQFHAHAVKMHMDYDLHIQNSLVSMYAKCGNLSDACQIFANIQAPNVDFLHFSTFRVLRLLQVSASCGAGLKFAWKLSVRRLLLE